MQFAANKKRLAFSTTLSESGTFMVEQDGELRLALQAAGAKGAGDGTGGGGGGSSLKNFTVTTGTVITYTKSDALGEMSTVTAGGVVLMLITNPSGSAGGDGDFKAGSGSGPKLLPPVILGGSGGGSGDFQPGLFLKNAFGWLEGMDRRSFMPGRPGGATGGVLRDGVATNGRDAGCAGGGGGGFHGAGGPGYLSITYIP